ncbi:thioesterase superfamily [Micractinium conductrix]|uniref:Thioesterase superfamily n=1 Tax=Micractinium conductrix TaxID=554055 RepID=A0A2P6V5D9_9CHLO|nr:thioesterase superfamily [Micractinium conductrix]|eukprot:PSC69292.1 thioesterase superfamily [Micractinium conductrix]
MLRTAVLAASRRAQGGADALATLAAVGSTGSPWGAAAAAAEPSQCSSCPSSCTCGSRGARWAHSSGHRLSGSQWEVLRNQGFAVNPCNSRLHPSFTEAGIEPDQEEELSVQEAYTPESTCWGCGPAAGDGLNLRSYRIPGGLEATVELSAKYSAFPGIINGGVVQALFDCHGNWTAAIALMDKAALPKPPLTLTYEMLCTFKETTPPAEPLILRSQIVRIKESEAPGSKATVQVDMNLYHSLGGHEKLLASSTGIFKKLGALRAL